MPPLRAGPFFVSVIDDLNAPRIILGESAQIDPSDREPIDGKLFMVRWNGNDDRRSIAQLGAEADGAWELGFMNDATRHLADIVTGAARSIRPASLVPSASALHGQRRA